MAPPRRKSCLACVKAKRRCDVALPKCQRCTTKDIPCDYAGLGNPGPNATPNTNQETLNASPTEPVWLDPADTEGVDDVTASLLEQDQHSAHLSDVAWSMTAPYTSHQNVTSDLARFDSDDQMNWPPEPHEAGVEGYINPDRAIFEPGDDYITTGVIYHERVRFASRQFQRYPEMFYKRGQTPFIHRQMYIDQTPPVIQDALSSCALYCGKNNENELLVFNSISSKARDLVDRQEPSMTPVDLLASTQALLMYQITRLFDGDIRQRADAESDETTLISWTEQLLARTRQLDLGASSMSALITSSWNDWIFEESCRRTIVTSYMLQGVYSFLKFGYDNVSGKVDKLSFTAQEALWNAPSEFHWKQALSQKNQFQVIIGKWDTAMEGLTPGDIEELGMLIMACLKGIELPCEWLGKDNLQRWGLE